MTLLAADAQPVPPVPAAERAANPDLRQWLRAQTATRYARAEELPIMRELASGGIARARYVAYLRATHLFYRGIELAVATARPHGYGLARWQQHQRIAIDLAILAPHAARALTRPMRRIDLSLPPSKPPTTGMERGARCTCSKARASGLSC